MPTALMPDDFKILENNIKNPGIYADTRIKISGRIFNKNLRFEKYYWKDIEFINCDFIGCTMLSGALVNVKFSNCLFFANAWHGKVWEDVYFEDCAWRGPFRMTANGGKKNICFDRCEFVGATAEEIGYGNEAEQYGVIGGTSGGVRYENCSFERVFINGGMFTELESCSVCDAVLYGKDNSSLALKHITGKKKVRVDEGNFLNVIVKKSNFEDLLSFNEAKIEHAVFEDVIANLDLTLLKAKTVEIRHMTFSSPVSPKQGYQYGLVCESAKIGKLDIVNSSFQGPEAALFLQGEKQRTDETDDMNEKYENVYSTAIQDLTIINTPVRNANFTYMEISNFKLANSTIANVDFSNSKILNFSTESVVLAGRLKFENTVILKRDTTLPI